MANFSFDPKAHVSKGGGGMPSPGKHIACVSDAVVKRSKSGNDMIVCNFTIIEPGSEDFGRSVRYEHYVLTDKALWKLADLSMAVGQVEPWNPTDQDSVDRCLLGMPLVIEVEVYEETYKGDKKTRCKVAAHSRLNESQTNALFEAHGEFLIPRSVLEDIEDEKAKRETPF